MQMSRMNHPRVPVPPVRRHHFISLFIQNISPFLIAQEILDKLLALPYLEDGEIYHRIIYHRLLVYWLHLPNMVSIRRSRLAVSHPSEDEIEECKNRAFSLMWLASMLIYWNKRKFLHKKRVQFPQGCLGTPTWSPFHCFGTPIWLPRRHVKGS